MLLANTMLISLSSSSLDVLAHGERDNSLYGCFKSEDVIHFEIIAALYQSVWGHPLGTQVTTAGWAKETVGSLINEQFFSLTYSLMW